MAMTEKRAEEIACKVKGWQEEEFLFIGNHSNDGMKAVLKSLGISWTEWLEYRHDFHMQVPNPIHNFDIYEPEGEFESEDAEPGPSSERFGPCGLFSTDNPQSDRMQIFAEQGGDDGYDEDRRDELDE